MRRLVMLSAVLIGFGLPPGPASALPAPMSQEQLLEKSDLVALVRIKSVTCVSVAKDDRTGEDLPSYSARAELIEVIKGEDVKGDTVNITFHAIPTGLLGPWTVYYYPGRNGLDASPRRGRRIHLHLVERPRRRGKQGGHHRAADQTRRDRRNSQRRKLTPQPVKD